MKKLITTIVFTVITSIIAIAQPNSLNYQGVARNSSGNPLASQSLGIRISILDGSATGTEVFKETHSVTTNSYGMYKLNIGEGTAVTGTLGTVDWANGDKYIKVEMGPAGGSSYTDLGTEKMNSVPFAKQAEALNIYQSGTSNTDKMVITHSPTWQNYGLMYSDLLDRWHFVAASVKSVTINPNSGGSIGIGSNASSPMAGSLHTEGDRMSSIGYNANVRVVQRSSSSGNFAGLSLLTYGTATANGVILYGISGSGGLNVADTNGGGYKPVNASAFNVFSDRRLKKDIVTITNQDYENYLQQIRNIESATYYYNNETKEERKLPHVGFIAQTLPNAIQTELNLFPDGKTNEKRIGYNLSDFAGLSLVGIKALDYKNQQLEQKVAEQDAKIKLLEEKLAKLESILSSTK